MLHLREREPQGDLRLCGRRQIDARPKRFRCELPAPDVLLEPHLESARGRAPGVAGEDVPHELPGSRRIGVREGARRARLQLELRRPALAETRLVEQRLAEGPRVSRARRGPLQPEDGAAPVLVDREHLLVCARGARRVAEELLPEERDLLQIRCPPAGVRRLLGGLRVELDQSACARVARLREHRRQQARERVEHPGVARCRDPRGAQVPNRVRGPADLDADLGGALERGRA